MHTQAKRIGAGVAFLVIVYLAVLPMVWPEPRVEIAIPSQAAMHDILHVHVCVHALHRNIDVGQVRFYVDYTSTTAVGSQGIFNPELIVQREPRRFVGPFARNPITWPYSQCFDGEVGLANYINQGLIGPGELIGKIDVTFNYCSGRGGKYPTSDRTRTMTKSVPFRVVIHE